MDDDAGTLFKPLLNVEALNFFVNNEMNNSENVVDYFDDNFVGTLLEDDCLLVSIYVHYTYLIQSNNFNYCLTKISIRAKRSISRVFSLFIVPSPFFVHCPYKGRINRAESVLTGLKPY